MIFSWQQTSLAYLFQDVYHLLVLHLLIFVQIVIYRAILVNILIILRAFVKNFMNYKMGNALQNVEME